MTKKRKRKKSRINFFFLPFKAIFYLWIKFKIFLRKENYIILKIPSKFKSSKKSFITRLLQKKQEEEIFLIDFLETLHNIYLNPKVKKVLFIVEEPTYSFAEVENIVLHIKKLKQKNIQTSGYILTGDIKSLYLLSSMDQRFSLSSSQFQSSLFAGDFFFFKGLLDKLGIKIESFQSGGYKSFAEKFIRENFSQKAKENFKTLFKSLNTNLKESFQSISVDSKILEFPFLRASVLKKKNFITDFMTETNFLEKYEKNKQFKRFPNKSLKIYKTKNNFSFKSLKKGKIAMISLNGSISLGKSSETQFKHKKIQYYPLKKIFNEIKENDSTQGIILEINSPGGSALASELIYQEIQELRKTKKIYAYLQNVAASGGYYIACACDKIYANLFTITGSIGTVMIKPSLKNLYDKIGIQKDKIEFYPLRDISSEYENLSNDSIKYLENEIKIEEENFYNRVMQSRKKSREDMEHIGQGRVFTARDFIKLQMLDKICSIYETLEDLQKELNIEKLKTQHYTSQHSIKENLEDLGVQSKIFQDLLKVFQLESEIQYIDVRLL